MKREALLYEKLEGDAVRCALCAHGCRIEDSKYGICGVRKNEKGMLHTRVYGEVIASHADPIEKKPLYHFLPGTKSYSIATIGCNFRCGFCQNWQISQASDMDKGSGGYELKPEEAVREAGKRDCKSISYTYTEPTVFFEFAYDTAKIAKREGLYNCFVTNGYMTRRALDVIGPYLDAANVDLKSFNDKFYKENCGARLEPVLDSIGYMKKRGIWVEVTTLVIPGQNDSEKELSGIADFIAGVDRAMPWHISRFHPDYRFTDKPNTPLATLKKAEEIGRARGLRYVYLGNVTEDSNTVCPECGETLVRRSGFYSVTVKIEKRKCPSCGSAVEGLWEQEKIT